MKTRYYRRHRADPSLTAWIVLLIGWIVAMISLGAVLGISAYKPDKRAEVCTPVPSGCPLPTAEHQSLCVQTIAFHSKTSLRNEDPTILIYHTHNTEAYCPTDTDPYEHNGTYRTYDNTKNVVAVGEELKHILEEQYGFCVLHDTTDHEPPKLSSAYERSEQTMLSYRERYPSLILYIDLHRDAYNVTTEPTTDFAEVYDEETARLMFVVGTGEKYDVKPYYVSNLNLAETITDHLSSIQEKLMRPVRIKTGRYNQHIAPYCLLVEVGHNANTLEQALAAVPYLAEGIAFAFSEIRTGTLSLLPEQSDGY